MKKLFGNKTKGKRDIRRYEKDVLDFDEEYEDDYYEDDRYEDDEYYEDEDDYPEDEDDYPDDDVEDDRYEDEDDYPEDDVEDDRYEDDDDYPEDDMEDRYEDEDEYPDDYEDDRDEYYEEDGRYEDEEYYEDDDRYEDEEYYEDDRYDEDNRDVYYPGDNRRSENRRRRDRDDRESVFARIGGFLAGTSAVERIAAIFAIFLVAGGVLTASFYISAKNNRSQLEAFSEVGSTMSDDIVVGESGLIAVADAERAKAMAANLVSDDAAVLGESREVEEEVADDAEGVTIKMTVTSIKSDIKVKFINSKTNKLVANLPLEIEVVGPDGTKVTYNDHDQDGIIYKKDITKGEYKITPKALPSGYEKYKLELKSKTVTVKDTVEMKAVDVSNEVKKESQVNAAKEDTAVKTEVESKLEDTVEWVESTKVAAGESSDGSFTYEEVSKSDIPDPSSSSMVGTRSWMFLGFARGRSSEGSSLTSSGDGAGEGNSNTGAGSEEQKDKISISANNTMTVGDKQTVSISGTTKDVNVTSSDNDVITVSGKELTANKAGTATITASGDNCESDSITITVKEKEVVNSDFSGHKTNITVQVGKSDNIGATAKSTISYESKDKSIATVSADGTVTGVKEGSTTITLKAEGYNDATVNVVVAKADDKDMKFEPSTISVKIGGDPVQIKVTEPTKVEYKSENEKIAKVTSDGKVSAVAEGSTNIILKADGYKETKIPVTVAKADAKTMKVEPATITMKVGSDPVSIKVTEPEASKVTYKSSNEKVATVKDGKVTAVAEGTADITISDKDKKYDDFIVKVTVTKKNDAKVPMSISKITLVEGQQIKVSSSDSKVSIKLESSNSNVASVSDTTITGKSAGDAVITVTAKDYEKNEIAVKVVGKGTTLKDKNGNTLYVLKSDGSYREATYEDYYSGVKLYKRKATTTYRYTGWQTIGGKTYFYDKNGNVVTGEQVIQGAKYTFGSDGALQSGSGTMGIDVSKWNGNIDWNAVKNSGINYVIIRCGYRGSSEGALIEDPKFRANINGAQNAGIKVGVYFFTQAVNEVEAVEEASMVINLIKGYNISYPVYLDVEASHGRGDGISPAQRTANIKAFCGTIQNAGYRAGVYANKTWFTSYINTSQITNYRIWLAQYASAVTYTGSRYDMWQYSSKGRVTGISGYVDMNICY